MFQDQLSHLHVIVFCEDTLTQLWPLSRQQAPFDLQEQPQGKSLLMQTLDAVAPLSSQPITLVVPEELSDATLDHLVAQDSELFDRLEIVSQARPESCARPGTHAQSESCEQPGAQAQPSRYDQPDRYEQPSRYDQPDHRAQPASHLFYIALLAARIKLKDPQAVLMLISTHQQFEAGDLWASAVSRAYKAALDDYIVLLGTQPHESIAKPPCVTPLKEFEDLPGVFTARQYIHKPALNYSIRMNAQKVMWCMDITLVKATALLGQINRAYSFSEPNTRAYRTQASAARPSNQHAPSFQEPAESLARLVETANFLAPLSPESWRSPEAAELLASLPATSFSEAVLEQSDRLAIVPTSFAWRGFSDYEEVVEQNLDNHGNSIEGRGLLANAERTLVYSKTQKLTVCLGTKNLMVVDTPDALLIADRDQLDSLGEVLQILKNAEAPEL